MAYPAASWIVVNGTYVEEFKYRLDIARVTGGGPTLNINCRNVGIHEKYLLFCAIF